jgi:hypothetical protein
LSSRYNTYVAERTGAPSLYGELAQRVKLVYPPHAMLYKTRAMNLRSARE